MTYQLKHPARCLTYTSLLGALNTEIRDGNVSVVKDGPLVLYKYTPQCVFEKKWNDVNRLARGLILNEETGEVVATPFPKFFNYAEHDVDLPDEPFEVTEKVDGSLGIIFYDSQKQRWRVATRGSFQSEQAQWAEMWLHRNINLDILQPGTTYLVEIVYSANRIVITYDFEGLVLLGAYDLKGLEYNRIELETVAYCTEKFSRYTGFKPVQTINCNGLNELLSIAQKLERDKEGFVVRFQSGLRIKIKGDEYCRVHRLVSNVTPLAVWDLMAAGDDLSKIERELPEEFRKDFESICIILNNKFIDLREDIFDAKMFTDHMNDKILGLWLKDQTQFSEEVARWIFPARKKNLLQTVHEPGNIMRRRVFEIFRPTSNRLDGYIPSSLLNRFTEEQTS